MIGIKINIKAACVYLFGLFIMFLAAMSMGGVLLYFFYLCLLIPIVSCIQLIINIINFKYFEEFSTEHPVKGEAITYRLEIVNESPLFIPSVTLQFKEINYGTQDPIKDIHTSLNKNESLKKSYIVTCPYRGIYTIGLDSITITDFLGWISYSPKVWYRTFYVYPKIIMIAPSSHKTHNNAISSGHNTGTSPDNTLFRTLKEYRQATPIRHIAWKKFAAIGTPYIKEYDTSSLPGIDIYLDLRRKGPATDKILTQEDTSIEIVVALVKMLLEHHIPVNVHAYSTTTYTFSGKTPHDFDPFYRSTINLTFDKDISPIQVYINNKEQNNRGSSSLVFISHTPDPELFAFCTEHANSAATSLIFNIAGMNESEKAHARSFRDISTKKGARVLLVRNNETIKQDLKSW